MTPEMETAVKYQSHLPALLACIAVTDGPVLELGVGYFSTPHLHALCGAMGRDLASIESDPEWFGQFKHLRRVGYGTGIKSSISHTLFLGDCPALLAHELKGLRWSVVFIDHSPGGANRAAAFKALIEVSDYVVVHDAQKDAENFQAIEPMLEGLNWHLCTEIFPHTLVCSKTRKIPEVLLSM